NLLKLLDVSVDENVLPTTYGKLQPPLGTHRLKIDVRPAVYHYQGRDSDDDDYQDRDYDVSALANNLSQAFRYGISENDDNIEVLEKCIVFFLSRAWTSSFYFLRMVE
ncbi:serine/threonine-protein phosphatase 6 regulatory subunit 3-like protein isoform X2, partial [Tanacetum coccineum]